MSKKNLIIGAITKYNINQLKPWVLSINEVTDKTTTHKVMIVGDITSETRKWLIDNDFKLIEIYKSDSHKPLTSQWIIRTDIKLSNKKYTRIPIHVARFLYIYECLRNEWEKYDYVVTTDVKDVYFQTDPFKWLNINLGEPWKLVAATESLKYKDEPWNSKNLEKAYNPYVYDLFKNNEIYNVGIIGGRAEYVKDLAFNIFMNAVNRPIAVVDQAVFNVLINTLPFKDIVKFLKQCDGWACQAGASVDPSVFQTFKPLLLEAEPIWKDAMVLTGQDGAKTLKGTPFCMVHQYDRVPEWNNYVQSKFGCGDNK